MYSLDTNINLSVERSIERTRKVQAHGKLRGTEAISSFSQMGGKTGSGRPVLRFVAALLVAAVMVALVIAL